MVYYVAASLAFRNTTRRNAISSNIQTRVDQAGTWGEVVRSDFTTPAGDPATRLTVRFTTQAEADLFWTDIVAAIGTGINGPVEGSNSFIERHNCPHDEEDHGGCVTLERINY